MYNLAFRYCAMIQKSKILEMKLEISKTVIYNIATKDIAPMTIYHTGAKTSREEAQGMKGTYVLGYICGIIAALLVLSRLQLL